MALVKCPNCGKEISEKAFKCLHCDFKIEGNDVNNIEENSIQQNLCPPRNNENALDYHKIGIASMIISGIAWIMGFIRLFIYGDPITFVGLVLIGGALAISAPLIMIYDKLRDK